MTESSPREITQLLQAWSAGDSDALEKLTPLVYKELHRLAKRYMNRERAGHPLQATALLNEAYLRLIDWSNVHWRNRAHFFGVSARLMRQVLVDIARAHRQRKRGGDLRHVSFDEALIVSHDRPTDLIALDDALNALATIDPRKSQVVELRYFGGLSIKETAEILKISSRTVLQDWNLARGWLLREISKNSEG